MISSLDLAGGGFEYQNSRQNTVNAHKLYYFLNSFQYNSNQAVFEHVEISAHRRDCSITCIC